MSGSITVHTSWLADASDPSKSKMRSRSDSRTFAAIMSDEGRSVVLKIGCSGLTHDGDATIYRHGLGPGWLKRG